ncbi:DUF3177 family protein [Leptolyngbya ohadii]|uniref:DUF3177 family protein n=1 Tax=Leptolyngbya ohadii TaxID=1962290 RepID=UPI000B598E70|nr:DUF3177 family protein [Leptolyngbya ohadii]
MISQDLLQSLVWLDYRLALLFTVFLPLVLLVWALFAKAEAASRLLIIYWRVASLLAITVYLLMGNLPIGFLAGLAGGILIPISLWFWVDLNEEINEQPKSGFKLAFTAWRWAVSLYCMLGVLTGLPFLQCGFSQTAFTTPFCQVWLQPAIGFHSFLHARYTTGFLGFIGIAGLVIYTLYLIYFVFVRLGKQGRSAIEQ